MKFRWMGIGLSSLGAFRRVGQDIEVHVTLCVINQTSCYSHSCKYLLFAQNTKNPRHILPVRVLYLPTCHLES